MAGMPEDRHFDEKKTVKVSGVSQLLRDQIEKEFQTHGNTANFSDDVSKLHVCPDGEDYVLVEFSKEIPSGKILDCRIMQYNYTGPGRMF